MKDCKGVELVSGDKIRIKIVNYGVLKDAVVRDIPENVIYYTSDTTIGSTLSEYVEKLENPVLDMRGREIHVGDRVWLVHPYSCEIEVDIFDTSTDRIFGYGVSDNDHENGWWAVEKASTCSIVVPS